MIGLKRIVMLITDKLTDICTVSNLVSINV